ncbi:undecaprenyl/decaprenyl-phosphate alpha-N-acetylglucosaminyl 1-phosphate transferase [Patescibacteria group bacterium]|nr:undecaprenyl/decaprenyl-phosphate alpha-N-acetylglucosaminyl 1-phosphate transferase [Patescibacteria group bacterium]
MLTNVVQFVTLFFLAGSLSALLTLLTKKLALRWGIVDQPEGQRKIHRKPIPLLGGVAVFLAFTLVLLFFLLWDDSYFTGYMLPKHIAGIILGGLILMVGGVLDDKYNLSPGKLIIWPVLASLVIITAGIGIDFISNPFGSAFRLDLINIEVLNWQGVPYYFTPLADIFTLLWLLGMVYTTKLLDGLDGLVSGVTVIGAVVLFFLSLTPQVMQPETALLCIVLAGAALGFLLLNFHPARIFLGEAGSTWVGFMLGVLAIISGGKIATALLIMGIPILDVGWVIARRLWFRQSPFKSADRKHLHFRLLDLGFTQRGAVVFFYIVSAIFGSVALLVEGKYKSLVLALLFIFMFVLGMILVLKAKRICLPDRQVGGKSATLTKK